MKDLLTPRTIGIEDWWKVERRVAEGDHGGTESSVAYRWFVHGGNNPGSIFVH